MRVRWATAASTSINSPGDLCRRLALTWLEVQSPVDRDLASVVMRVMRDRLSKVRVISYIYPVTCSQKGYGGGSAAAETAAVIILHIFSPITSPTGASPQSPAVTGGHPNPLCPKSAEEKEDAPRERQRKRYILKGSQESLRFNNVSGT